MLRERATVARKRQLSAQLEADHAAMHIPPRQPWTKSCKTFGIRHSEPGWCEPCVGACAAVVRARPIGLIRPARSPIVTAAPPYVPDVLASGRAPLAATPRRRVAARPAVTSSKSAGRVRGVPRCAGAAGQLGELIPVPSVTATFTSSPSKGGLAPDVS